MLRVTWDNNISTCICSLYNGFLIGTLLVFNIGIELIHWFYNRLWGKSHFSYLGYNILMCFQLSMLFVVLTIGGKYMMMSLWLMFSYIYLVAWHQYLLDTDITDRGVPTDINPIYISGVCQMFLLNTLMRQTNVCCHPYLTFISSSLTMSSIYSGVFWVDDTVNVGILQTTICIGMLRNTKHNICQLLTYWSARSLAIRSSKLLQLHAL